VKDVRLKKIQAPDACGKKSYVPQMPLVLPKTPATSPKTPQPVQKHK